MADYIEFASPDGTVLVEVDESETSSQRGGIQKAGIRDTVSNTVAAAQSTFEEVVRGAIRSNAQVFLQAVLDLSPLPSEAEISFALKMTGEAGNVAVAKVGGEANYAIKLTWKREAKASQQDGN